MDRYVYAGTPENGPGDPVSPWRLLRRAICLLLAACATAVAGPAVAQMASEPEIISREAWGALPPNLELMQEHKPIEIILHHTGEHQQPRVSLEAKMRGLQHFGMTPGKVGLLAKPAWGDIPYHYYIEVGGKIGEGRDIGFAGDATTSFDNDGRIQITVEGDFEREQPTQGELESLKKLVTWLAFRYGIPAENISGHGDHDQTNCPGRNLKPFLEELRKAVQQETGLAEK
jgi:hypothetical protein